MPHNFSQDLLDKITIRAENIIKEVVTGALTEEIRQALSKALAEGEFYRAISNDLQEGLKSIYKEINAATISAPSESPATVTDANEIFSEASKQLGAILQTTESATESIMTLVEKHLEKNDHNLTLLNALESSKEIRELQAHSQELGQDLMSIMTSLSFQDLTGQRIKRIVTALQQIEKVVFELYMSTGLSLKAMSKNPDQPVEQIRQDSKKRVSKLAGPQDETSQQDVDDLLNQLGL